MSKQTSRTAKWFAPQTQAPLQTANMNFGPEKYFPQIEKSGLLQIWAFFEENAFFQRLNKYL